MKTYSLFLKKGDHLPALPFPSLYIAPVSLRSHVSDRDPGEARLDAGRQQDLARTAFFGHRRGRPVRGPHLANVTQAEMIAAGPPALCVINP